MSLVVRMIVLNLLHTGLAGAIALLLFLQVVSLQLKQWETAIWVLMGGQIIGTTIHAFFVDRWLNKVDRYNHTPEANRTDAQAHQAVDQLLRFPYRSVVLSLSLWVVIVVSCGLMLAEVLHATGYMFAMVTAIFIGVGMWSALVQMFHNRTYIMPQLEQTMSAIKLDGADGQDLIESALFPSRAKWLMILAVLIGFATLSAMVFGFGFTRELAYDTQLNNIQAKLDAFLPKYEASLRNKLRDPHGYDIESMMRELQDRLRSEVALVNKGGGVVYGSAENTTELIQMGEIWKGRQESVSLIRRPIGDTEAELIAIMKWEEFSADLATLSRTLVLALLVASFIVAVIGVLASGDVTRMIHRLEQQNLRLLDGDFRHPVYLLTDDELYDLAVSIEETRSEVSSVLAMMQGVNTAVSSELDGMVLHAERMSMSSAEQYRSISLTSRILQKVQTNFDAQLSEVSALLQHVAEARESSLMLESELKAMDKQLSRLTDVVDRNVDFDEQAKQNLEVVGSHVDRLQTTTMKIDTLMRRTREYLLDLRGKSRNDRNTSQRTVGQSRDAATSVRQATESLDLVMGIFRDATELTDRLVATSGDLQRALKWVEEVADDTRLLSLNAAILSAQAEDEGRSFGVIATNIEQLAHGSEGALTQLRQDLMDLSQAAAELGQNIVTMHQRVDEQRSAFSERGEDLRDLASIVDEYMSASSQLDELTSSMESEERLMASRLMRLIELVNSLRQSYSSREFRRRELGNKLVEISKLVTEMRSYGQYQASRSHSVVSAIEQVDSMLNYILKFLRSRKEESRTFVESLDDVQAVIKENSEIADQLADKVEQMSTVSQKLGRSLSYFKVNA